MCGRFACSLNSQALQLLTNTSQFVDCSKYVPSYNMCPGNYVPVLLQQRALSNSKDKTVEMEEEKQERRSIRMLQAMKWGLVPSFSNDNKPFHQAINARVETIETKGLYRSLVNRRRCVVIMEGYYEWKNLSKGNKQPFLFYVGKPLHQRGSTNDTTSDEKELKNNVLFVAGLFDVWNPLHKTNLKKEEGEGEKEEEKEKDKEEAMEFDRNELSPLYSVSIVTCGASDSIQRYHDRMPLILMTDQQVDTWLNVDTYTLKKLKHIVLNCCQISRECVGNTSNRTMECVLPIEEYQKGIQGIERFFVRNNAIANPKKSDALAKEEQRHNCDTTTTLKRGIRKNSLFLFCISFIVRWTVFLFTVVFDYFSGLVYANARFLEWNLQTLSKKIVQFETRRHVRNINIKHWNHNKIHLIIDL
ncbi:hypothetical protein RFI_04356 [Reticulomyxa filosa]|uniref:Embryonic stem cell-specific 5-hydroxymethylcytosine-binding protein n=1 Tax=Reticulomyxa filosa TaxID=46433 RepID=X6P2H6_RETFI|nr:hypothetical protein RFI_04356 [Reticulomyxa filosa]|eukprot:ETO32760.1 hypothetical protein RFI_04356 [Reticulomyxa filosa]